MARDRDPEEEFRRETGLDEPFDDYWGPPEKFVSTLRCRPSHRHLDRWTCLLDIWGKSGKEEAQRTVGLVKVEAEAHESVTKDGYNEWLFHENTKCATYTRYPDQAMPEREDVLICQDFDHAELDW